MRQAAWLIVLASTCAGQSSLEPPLLGLMKDSGGQLRRVYGVSGYFVVGPVERANVLNVEFSGRSGAIKTASELLILDEHAEVRRSFAAPEGPAVFGFDANGAVALCWFARTGELWNVASDPPRVVPLDDPGGPVVAIEMPGDGRAGLLVSAAGALWMKTYRLTDGRAIAAEPRASDDTMPLSEGARRPERMGAGWLAAAPFAIQLTPDGARVYRLPAAKGPR